MFDHVKFGVSDYAASKAFFLKALEPLGVAVVAEGSPTYGVELSPKGNGASLCLHQSEEKPAHLHLAFTAESRRQVDAFHRAALEAGGKDHGAPGLRPQYHASYYAAFVIGPDGHNIEVVCHEPEAFAPHTESIADQVTLREITAETVRAVTKLSVTAYQNRFVASNAVSLAQALFAPEAWYRAIYLAEEPVGFVMLEDESLREPMPASPAVGVWRLMVDARHQRKGVGRAAMHLVIEHVRRKGLFEKLAISYVPEEGGPEQLYLSLGFRPTGEMDEDEVVMELPLGAGAA